MNSLVDNYLLYISKSVNNYLKVMLKSDKYIDQEKTTDVIYDYLNEVFLLKKSNCKINYNRTFKMKLNDEETSLLNIFTEYGLIDRIKLKDKNIKKSYIFVVDAIRFFINLEIYIYKKQSYSYNQAFSAVIKNTKYLDKQELKVNLNARKGEIIKIFEHDIEIKKQLMKMNLSPNFNTIEYKIGSNLVFDKTSYLSEELFNYNYREVKYIESGYLTEIYLSCLENMSLKILKELIISKNKKHIIYIPEYILRKKKNIADIKSIFNICSIANSVCFAISIDNYQKYRNSYDLSIYYKVALIIKDEIYDNIDLSNIDYLIVNYSDDSQIDELLKKIDKEKMIIFNGSIPKDIKSKLESLGYKYCVSKKVKYE